MMMARMVDELLFSTLRILCCATSSSMSVQGMVANGQLWCSCRICGHHDEVPPSTVNVRPTLPLLRVVQSFLSCL